MKRLWYTLLNLFYRAAHSIYDRFKDTVKPYVLRRPRLHRFLVAIKDPLKQLVRSPEVMTAGSIPRGDGSIPEWLIEEWREMNEIEPQLFPDEGIIKTVQFNVYDTPESSMGRHYLDLCSRLGDENSHIFLVPWLVRGGADLVMLNYIKALLEIDPLHKITVIATLNADSPWSEKLPINVRFIEFGKLYSSLTAREQERLLARALLQKPPRVIHNINSDLGFRIFVHYGKGLKTLSHLFVCSFCEDMTSDGKLVGYPFMYLPGCFDALNALFSDNKSFLNKLHEIYAFDHGKMHVHYQPMGLAASDPPKHREGGEDVQILWAGRLDRQKRPDVLIAIAEECVGMPVHFHVYGSALIDQDEYIRRFSALRNIRYHGHFDGLSTLPIHEYDLFLYTTQWDGLPNVLLEAISLGLPVIAPDVGGIAELIKNEETGFLVGEYDNADAYVQCLRKVLDERKLLPAVEKNALALVRQRHSWDVFIEQVRKVPDYA